MIATQPTLIDQNGHLYLAQADQDPIKLGNFEPDAWQLNIKNATNLKGSALFIGMGHALFLKESDFVGKNVIIIEKNKWIADYFLKKARPEILAKIHLIVGEHGFKLPQDRLDKVFHEDDIHSILFKLFELPDHFFQDIQIFNPVPGPLEAIQYNELIKGILLAIDAKRYHLKNTEQYKETNQNAPRWGAIVSNATDAPWMKRLERNDGLFVDILYWDQSELPARLNPRPDLASPESFFYIHKNEALKQWIISNQITHVCWKNRSIFRDLGDIFFGNETLKRLGLQLHALYVDWFHEQSFISEGGRFFYSYYSHLDSQENIGTIYQADALLHPPLDTKAPLTLTPFVYSNPGFKLRTPLQKNRENFKWDVIAIHHTRQQYCQNSDHNELFDLMSQAEPEHADKSAFAHLEHLRHFISTQEFPLNSHRTNDVLNYLHFVFYCISRFREIRQNLTTLAGDYRVALFGPQWGGLLPDTLLHPPVYDAEALSQIYHDSVLTIDFSPNFFMDEMPFINVINSYVSGGLCVSKNKIFETFDAPLFASHHLIPTFSCPSDLRQIVKTFTSDIKKRNDLVSEIQNDLRAQIHGKPFPSSPQALHPSKTKTESFISRLETKEWILTAAVGYLHFMSGCRLLAVNCWRQALEMSHYVYEPLALKLIHTLQSMQDNQQASDVMAQVLKLNPASTLFKQGAQP